MAQWVRVDADIWENPKVWEFALALVPGDRLHTTLSRGPSADELAQEVTTDARAVTLAVGYLVSLWHHIAAYRPDGNLAGLPDGLLEQWARWGGAPGHFAALFRKTFAPNGIVNDWHTYQGRAIEHRERERERKRRARSHGQSAPASAPGPADSPRTVRATSTSTTTRDDNENNSSSSSSARARAKLPEAYHDAYDGFRRAARNPAAFDADLDAMLTGMHGPPLKPGLVGVALLEMAGAGCKYSAKAVRAFVRELERRPAEAANGKTERPGRYGEWDRLMAKLAAEEAASK